MMFFTLIDPLSDIHGSWRIVYVFHRGAPEGGCRVDHNRDSVPAFARFVNLGGFARPRGPAFREGGWAARLVRTRDRGTRTFALWINQLGARPVWERKRDIAGWRALFFHDASRARPDRVRRYDGARRRRDSESRAQRVARRRRCRRRDPPRRGA